MGSFCVLAKFVFWFSMHSAFRLQAWGGLVAVKVKIIFNDTHQGPSRCKPGRFLSTHLNQNNSVREGVQKKLRFYLGLCPKLWVGGGQES